MRSLLSGTRKTSKKAVIPDNFDKPIMEVVTTLKDNMGGTSKIKGVSIAAEEELKSLKKS